MEFIYFICVGAYRAKVGEFARMVAYRSLAAAHHASIDVLREVRKSENGAGVEFSVDYIEVTPEHVMAAWSSSMHTIWIERLPIDVRDITVEQLTDGWSFEPKDTSVAEHV